MLKNDVENGVKKGEVKPCGAAEGGVARPEGGYLPWLQIGGAEGSPKLLFALWRFLEGP